MLKIWNELPKTIKVFFYLALSTILSELAIELGGLEQTFLIRILAQLINLGIVFLEESIETVRFGLKEKE